MPPPAPYSSLLLAGFNRGPTGFFVGNVRVPTLVPKPGSPTVTQGLRDSSLLDSVLARPRQLLAYGEPDIPDLAAAYAAAIIRNHPFVDGNKRTAFMAAYVFLASNGLRLVATEVDADQVITFLAASEINETAFAAWLRKNSESM